MPFEEDEVDYEEDTPPEEAANPAPSGQKRQVSNSDRSSSEESSSDEEPSGIRRRLEEESREETEAQTQKKGKKNPLDLNSRLMAKKVAAKAARKAAKLRKQNEAREQAEKRNKLWTEARKAEMALEEKEKVVRALKAELDTVKAALAASRKTQEEVTNQFTQLRADLLATSTVLRDANQKIKNLETERSSVAPKTSLGSELPSLSEPLPDETKSASDSRRRNTRTIGSRASSSTTPTAAPEAGGAGRLPLDRYLEVLMASPDPDPSYELDEFEMAFAKKVLGLAVEARKVEMQYQRRHEYRQMSFDDLIQFREDMIRRE